jgi:pimeloyl-ACP methyl ester carboxylesterase
MQLTHYRAGSGEPLVLVHGIGSRWQMWEPVVDRLTSKHDVIALDLPGFGASSMPPPGTPAGLDSLASLVLGFLAELGVERPHVAGNSLGGLLALELAKRDAVRSANALSPAGFANPFEGAFARGSLKLSVRAAHRIAAHAEAVMATKFVRVLALGQLVAHPTRLSPAEAAASVRALAGAPWFDATLKAVVQSFEGGERISVPVTIAWGEKDRLLLPRQAARAARAIPTAKSVTLYGCGHVPTYDDPEQVARVLLEGAARR